MFSLTIFYGEVCLVKVVFYIKTTFVIIEFLSVSIFTMTAKMVDHCESYLSIYQIKTST